VRRLRLRDLVDRFRAVLASHRDAPDPEAAVAEFREAVEARGGSASPTELWSAFQSARIMHVPAARLAEAQTAAGGRAHSYLFTWTPPGVLAIMGACHGLEIPFVFGSTGHPFARPFTGISGAATRLSHKMQHAWIRFARNGVPALDRLPPWTAYQVPERRTMIFGRSCRLADSPLEGERRLLERWT
jgi:para-nitrobenzyl esterase